VQKKKAYFVQKNVPAEEKKNRLAKVIRRSINEEKEEGAHSQRSERGSRSSIDQEEGSVAHDTDHF